MSKTTYPRSFSHAVHALGAALAAAGVRHESVLLRATDHGFDLNWGGFGTQLARARISRFLAEHS